MFIQLEALSFEEGQDISHTRPNLQTGTGFTLSFEDAECAGATNSITSGFFKASDTLAILYHCLKWETSQ